MASMIDKEWQDWTDSFLALAESSSILPLDATQIRAFVNLNFLEGDGEAQRGLVAHLKDNFIWKVTQKRADLYQLKYTVPMLAFVCTMCDTPCKAVMWVHALKRLEQKKGLVTLGVLVQAFPMGFPTSEALYKMWEAQKGLNGTKDNYLDTVGAS